MFRPCSFKNAMHGKITHTQFAGRMPTRSPIKATAFLRTRQRIVERIKMTAFMANWLFHRMRSPNRSVVASSSRGRVTSCFDERPKIVAAAKNALKAFGKRCKSKSRPILSAMDCATLLPKKPYPRIPKDSRKASVRVMLYTTTFVHWRLSSINW